MAETPEEFCDEILFPAFNNITEITECDVVFGNPGGTEVLAVALDDGTEWQIAISRKS